VDCRFSNVPSRCAVAPGKIDRRGLFDQRRITIGQPNNIEADLGALKVMSEPAECVQPRPPTCASHSSV
jgi:hypothetical protein